jgi:Ca2+/Na+ antiporter
VRSGAVLLATATAVLDWAVETWAVGAGNYDYAEGFTIETPLTYAMLVLGFLGILESVRDRAKP